MANLITKFPTTVANALKYYVYLYSHPETKEIFYVGKGKGDRVFAHLADENETEKVHYLKELKKLGLEPNIEILIHGLADEKTALRIESAVIDLVGKDTLTNRQSGWKSALYGRMTIEQIVASYDKQKVDVEEPSIFIRINKAFRYSMSETELYDFTRGQWKLSAERARHAKYAFSIYGGLIQEVYRVVDWYEAGQTYSIRQESQNVDRHKADKISGRYEFIGNFAEPEIRQKYKYKSVEHYFKQGSMNPILYVNC